MELTKNTILITGGSSGLGLALAARLLAMGNTVIVTGRDQAKLDRTKKQLPGIYTIQSDVSRPEAIGQLYGQVVGQFPKLNILVNNAGEMRKINLHQTDTDPLDLTRELTTNLLGPIWMVQQFVPHLKQQPTAAILNVTSGLALVPFPVSPIYGASKAGLRSYTQSLRVQLKGTSVKVFELVAPAVNTPLNDHFAGVEGFDRSILMEPDKLVVATIRGLQTDSYEIMPGFAKVIRFMSRLAPAFILSQTSKVGRDLMSDIA